MSEPLEMNVDFETSDTEMNMETDMNCNVKVPLPIASATQLGGIKVGENLSIAADGTLSAEVDNTLTISGAASDAKKVGDEISGLKEDLDENVNDLKSAFDQSLKGGKSDFDFLLNEQLKLKTNLFDGYYQNRVIDGETGEVSNIINLHYVSSVNFLPANQGTIIVQNIPNMSLVLHFWMFYYRSDHSFISRSYIANVSESMQFNAPENTKYIKIMIDYGGNEVDVLSLSTWITITQGAISNIVEAINNSITVVDNKIKLIDDYTGIIKAPLEKGKAEVVNGEYVYSDSNYRMRLKDTYGLDIKAGDFMTVTPMKGATLSGFFVYANKELICSGTSYASGYTFQQDYDDIVIELRSTTSVANATDGSDLIVIYRPFDSRMLNNVYKIVAFNGVLNKDSNIFDGKYSNQLYNASDGTAGSNNSEKFVSCVNPIYVSSGESITFDDFTAIWKKLYILYYGASGHKETKIVDASSGLPYTFVIPNDVTHFRFEFSFQDATNAKDVPIVGVYRNRISKVGKYNFTGMEYLGADTIKPYTAWPSSLTFIGNYLCCFSNSNDDHTDYKDINIMSVDYDTHTLTGYKLIHHNFGHCNTIDYCEQTDTLILGNGGTSSNVEHNQIYIIKNAKSVILDAENLSDVSLEDVALIIDIVNAGLDWGKQLNVCWAYSNQGRYDLAYAISNDGQTQTVRLIQLGKGNNELTYGTAVSEVVENDFNGTFSVIKSWSRLYSNDIANQDTQFYNGHLYESYGHGKINVDKMTLLEDGSIDSEFFVNPVYGANGDEVFFTSEGCAIKNGVLFVGIPEGEEGVAELRKIGMFKIPT